MWMQPDSALAVMMVFAASLEADSMIMFEGHYCQMITKELPVNNSKSLFYSLLASTILFQF